MKLIRFEDLIRALKFSEEERKQIEELNKARESIVQKLVEKEIESLEKNSTLGLNEVAKIWNAAKDVEIRNTSKDGYSAIEISFTIHGERNTTLIFEQQSVDIETKSSEKDKDDFRDKSFSGDFTAFINDFGHIVVLDEKEQCLRWVRMNNLWFSYSEEQIKLMEDFPKLSIKTNNLKFVSEDTIIHTVEGVGEFMVTSKGKKFRYKPLNNNSKI